MENPEVQSFKITKPGEEKKKRRGAGAWFNRASGAKDGWRGALGGAGRGGSGLGGGASSEGGLAGLRQLLSGGGGGFRAGLDRLLASMGLNYAKAALVLLITSASALGALAIGESAGMSTPASHGPFTER